MKLSGLFRELLSPLTTLKRIKRTDAAVAEMQTRIRWLENYTSSVPDQLEAARADQLFLCGQMATRQLPKKIDSIQDAEFRVFSQFGEDGIIQYLVHALDGKIEPSFVEFGVQTYVEANTPFLLMNNGWRGLVIDGEATYIDAIRKRGMDWKYGLKIRRDFVTRENINEIFREEGFTGELGLLSIDVDGVDWHLWRALTVSSPAIVIVEYNQSFPLDRPITVPYEDNFDRTSKHSSNRYFGASLSAFVSLAQDKGYAFVGVERHRQNAFFIRADLSQYVPRGVLNSSQVDKYTGSVMDILRGMPVVNAITGNPEVI